MNEEDELVNVMSGGSRNNEYMNQSKFNQTMTFNKQGINNLKNNNNNIFSKQGQNKNGGGIQSLINELSIESVDELGRVSLKQISIGGSGSSSVAEQEGRFSQGRSSQIKWKRKSEISRKSLENKSRISIKGTNQYEYILQEEDPFIANRNQQQNNQSQISRMSQKLEGAPSYEERKSKINQLYKQKFAVSTYEDFAPDEDDIGDELEVDERKFSIRALNFKMMSKLVQTILARASSKLLNSSRSVQSGVRNSNAKSSRITNQMRKVSRISKGGNQLSVGRESELYYYVDEGSLEEESDQNASHRCSMVKRYNLSTFFTPEKEDIQVQQQQRSSKKFKQSSPESQVSMEDTLNVNQPSNQNLYNNETIIEETGEGVDESQILNTRFSQKFRDDDDDNEEEVKNQFSNIQNEQEEQVIGRYSNVLQLKKENSDYEIISKEEIPDNKQQQQKQQQQQQTQDKKQKQNKLNNFVTKVPMPGQQQIQPPQQQQKQQVNYGRQESEAPFEMNQGVSSQNSEVFNNQEIIQTVVHQDSLQQQQQNEETQENQTSTNDAQANGNGQDLHKVHFFQTLQALQFIKSNLPIVPFEEIQDQIIYLPDPKRPELTKVLIFDMDETLIHCVDDIETEDPDVVLEIDFPDEETVYAGINIRPYVMECLEEANQNFQVIVFTASHQTYADAILDYIDPNHELIQYRMYRQHCILTKEGYYIKDLRVIGNRELQDLVIVDNSVYSFAFQIDNGIPIIPFYNDPNDEEMLHLIYYLSCLAGVEDVRQQNRAAFELYKLSNGDSQQQQQQQQQDEEEQMEEGEEEQQQIINAKQINNQRFYNQNYRDGGEEDGNIDLLQQQPSAIQELSRESSNLEMIENRHSAGGKGNIYKNYNEDDQEEEEDEEENIVRNKFSHADSLYNEESSKSKYSNNNNNLTINKQRKQNDF